MDLNILGVGAPEIIFFVILLLLLFGPKDLVRMARDAGRFIGRLTRSENYQVIQQASQELRNLPQRIVREAQLEELQELRSPLAPPRQGAPQSRPEANAPKPEPPAGGSPYQAWTQELPSSPPAGESTSPPNKPPASEDPPAS